MGRLMACRAELRLKKKFLFHVSYSSSKANKRRVNSPCFPATKGNNACSHLDSQRFRGWSPSLYFLFFFNQVQYNTDNILCQRLQNNNILVNRKPAVYNIIITVEYVCHFSNFSDAFFKATFAFWNKQHFTMNFSCSSFMAGNCCARRQALWKRSKSALRSVEGSEAGTNQSRSGMKTRRFYNGSDEKN